MPFLRRNMHCQYYSDYLCSSRILKMSKLVKRARKKWSSSEPSSWFMHQIRNVNYKSRNIVSKKLFCLSSALEDRRYVINDKMQWLDRRYSNRTGILPPMSSRYRVWRQRVRFHALLPKIWFRTVKLCPREMLCPQPTEGPPAPMHKQEVMCNM